MSGFEFGSRLTDSLAWPVFALLIVLVLRRPLAELLARRPLSRMKAGPFEVEWERVIAETETEVQALPGEPPRTTASTPSVREELAAAAKQAPAVAVLEAHAQVENALREVVNGPDPTGRRGWARLVWLGWRFATSGCYF